MTLVSITLHCFKESTCNKFSACTKLFQCYVYLLNRILVRVNRSNEALPYYKFSACLEQWLHTAQDLLPAREPATCICITFC